MRFFKLNKILALIATTFCGCSLFAQSNVPEISVDDYKNKYAKDSTVIVLDVRTPDEFKTGHLPRAINMDWYGADFGKKVAVIDTSRTIVVYCRSGKRAGNAIEKMQNMGFKHLTNLKGGIQEWIKTDSVVTNP
ncbi:MAG: rhodanese-like domain-containing protein [Tannerellaceae bacterium]